MFTKTSAIAQNRYFKSVSTAGPKSYQEEVLALDQEALGTLISYDTPVFLSSYSGITMLVVAEKPDGPHTKFILHGSIKLQAGVLFQLTSVSNNSQVILKTPAQALKENHTSTQLIQWEVLEPKLKIAEIYTSYYQVKKAPYHFGPEQHEYCELTIVEQGTLETTIEGVPYTLEKNDAILYQKNQTHTQSVSVDETTTYITILFDLEVADEQFFNRVFQLGAKQISQIERFIRISEEDHYPYKSDQLLARLKLLILSFLTETQTTTASSSAMKEKYDQEIIENITAYIKEHPEARVIDVSNAFGLSRSNIQNLFHRFIGMQPHAYIEEQRLKQAKILMRDSSYPLTDIARMVGYHSLPAFSRSFKHAFGYPPSEYAKKLYKPI